LQHVRCSVLQLSACVRAVCCRVLQGTAMYCRVLQGAAMRCSALQLSARVGAAFHLPAHPPPLPPSPPQLQQHAAPLPIAATPLYSPTFFASLAAVVCVCEREGVLGVLSEHTASHTSSLCVDAGCVYE